MSPEITPGKDSSPLRRRMLRYEFIPLNAYGDNLSPRLKNFIRGHIPEEERTYTSEEVVARMQSAGLNITEDTLPDEERQRRGYIYFKVQPEGLQYFTVTHPESGTEAHIYVNPGEIIAGDWLVEELTEDNISYYSRWYLRQTHTGGLRDDKETPVLTKLAEELGARVTVKLPERSVRMPLPFWYYHGTVPAAVRHEISGSTRVFVSEVQPLLDKFVKQVQELVERPTGS